MTIFMDKPRPVKFRRFKMTAHLFTDGTTAELDAFAVRLGMRVAWRQHSGTPEEHYDLFDGKLVTAHTLGATLCGRNTLVRVLMEKRKAAGLKFIPGFLSLRDPEIGGTVVMSRERNMGLFKRLDDGRHKRLPRTTIGWPHNNPEKKTMKFIINTKTAALVQEETPASKTMIHVEKAEDLGQLKKGMALLVHNNNVDEADALAEDTTEEQAQAELWELLSSNEDQLAVKASKGSTKKSSKAAAAEGGTRKKKTAAASGDRKPRMSEEERAKKITVVSKESPYREGSSRETMHQLILKAKTVGAAMDAMSEAGFGSRSGKALARAIDNKLVKVG